MTFVHTVRCGFSEEGQSCGEEEYVQALERGVRKKPSCRRQRPHEEPEAKKKREVGPVDVWLGPQKRQVRQSKDKGYADGAGQGWKARLVSPHGLVSQKSHGLLSQARTWGCTGRRQKHLTLFLEDHSSFCMDTGWRPLKESGGLLRADSQCEV